MPRGECCTKTYTLVYDSTAVWSLCSRLFKDVVTKRFYCCIDKGLLSVGVSSWWAHTAIKYMVMLYGTHVYK